VGDFPDLRSAWQELPWRRRRRLLKDVRRGRRAWERRDAALAAWRGMRELRRIRRGWLPLTVLGILVGISLSEAFEVLVQQEPFRLAADEWVFPAVGVAIGLSLTQPLMRGRLREGIAVNARFAAGEPVAGPADMEEAERLLVIMEREGWLRYQLVRDGEPPQSSPG